MLAVLCSIAELLPLIHPLRPQPHPSPVLRQKAAKLLPGTICLAAPVLSLAGLLQNLLLEKAALSRTPAATAADVLINWHSAVLGLYLGCARSASPIAYARLPSAAHGCHKCHRLLPHHARTGRHRALTWMMIAFRPDDTSISCAEVMYRSRRSLFSSALVASRSKSACGGMQQCP